MFKVQRPKKEKKKESSKSSGLGNSTLDLSLPDADDIMGDLEEQIVEEEKQETSAYAEAKKGGFMSAFEKARHALHPEQKKVQETIVSSRGCGCF